MENVVIAGSGPAGLTAAIYAARAGLSPLVIEGLNPGGQLIVSAEVENYPGFPEVISGMSVIENIRRQAVKFGVRFKDGSITTAIRKEKHIEVNIEEDVISAKTLIIATGAEARRLNVVGESKFYGHGVSGCATCDGPFFRGKEVLVVGGGNTAIEDALYLSTLAAHVTIIHRRDAFRAEHCELQKAKEKSNILWRIPWVLEEIKGGTLVNAAVIRNVETGETQTIECSGIFVAIGHNPKTAPFTNLVQMENDGYIRVSPKSTETTTPGVFACGDVCDSVYKQAIVAAGHGCMAALDVQRYINRKEK
jgi:thioredoxin reductase (NADPH)